MLPGKDPSTCLRLRKDDPRLAALGTIDELNAAVGLCVVEARRQNSARLAGALERAQGNLLRVGAMLAAIAAGAQPSVRLGTAAVTRMEKRIDAIWRRLGELKQFILPGGCELSARLHLARAVARRAERAAVAAIDVSQHSKRSGADAAIAAKYLNRLSDFLFALARQANQDCGQADQVWEP